QPVSSTEAAARIRTSPGQARTRHRQHRDGLGGPRARAAVVSYFDSAYIAKFYIDEPESDAVRQLAESLGQVWCAAIGQVEVTAVFHRKLREGAFDAAACREVMAQFQDDCRQGIWTWIPLTATVLGRAA